MTRVLQVMAGAPHGGAEAFFERLVPALARAGIDQRVVIRQNSERALGLRQQGLTAIELPFGGVFDITTRRALQRAARDFSPDIQLAWMSRAAKFCRPNGHVLAGRLGGYYDLKYFRRCEHLIGNTRDIRDYVVRSGWPTERAWYLPNFVDATPAEPTARADFDTADNVPLILALGRLHANKGFDILIAALADLPEAVLWLAGDGPEEAALRQEADRRGVAARVRFLGWQNDVAALLAAADIFVCPSRHEPLGNVVIEAWAHRRPVVASATAGPAALIEHEKSGLLVPVGDAGQLTAAVGRLLREPELTRDLASAGYAAFADQYNEEAVIAQYCEFFDQVRL